MLKNSKIARYQVLKRQNKGVMAIRKAVTMEERLLDSAFTLECMIIQNNCEDVIYGRMCKHGLNEKSHFCIDYFSCSRL